MTRINESRAVVFAVLCVGLHAVRVAQAGTIGELWPSNSLTKVLRSAAPDADAKATVAAQMCGSRGEVVSGQAVFRPAVDLAAVTASISDLRHHDSDATIANRHIALQWVRYIDVHRNSAGLPDDELVAKAPTSLPDPFWEGPTISAVAHQAQPIWIEVDVPRQTPSGRYDGCLVVQAGDTSMSLPVTLHIWDFDMPAQRHLSVINWGVFPGQTYGKQVTNEGPEYFRLFREYCAFLVAHRQTDVMGAIDWIERKGDEQTGFTYDTSRLERHAEVAFDAGICQIHLHAAGQKTAPILDPASRVEVPEHAGGVQRLSQLRALEQTIQRRGWQKRFLVAITDEPFIHHEETFAAAVDLVHQAAPSVRTVEAVETEYLGKLDVYVPKLSHLNLWYSHFDKTRREQGGELWFYTCCHPAGRYPNRFLDQSLLKVRVLHWINYLYDLQGYLHWGLNYYGSDNPFTEDGISKDLPLGDRAIVYPGENGILGSLRFSAQRDGLQDYEYLRTLEDRLRRQRTGGSRRVLAGSAAAVFGTLPPCDLVVSRLHTRSRLAVGHAACHRGGNRGPADRTVAGGADLATGRDSDPCRSADGQRPRSGTAGGDRPVERRARAECASQRVFLPVLLPGRQSGHHDRRRSSGHTAHRLQNISTRGMNVPRALGRCATRSRPDRRAI